MCLRQERVENVCSTDWLNISCGFGDVTEPGCSHWACILWEQVGQRVSVAYTKLPTTAASICSTAASELALTYSVMNTEIIRQTVLPVVWTRRCLQGSDLRTSLLVALPPPTNLSPVFSARQHMQTAERAIMLSPSVCPSVCHTVSVTRVDQSKTVEVRIMQFQHRLAHSLYFLLYNFDPEILTGSPWAGRQTRMGGNKLFSSGTIYDQSYWLIGSCICAFNWHRGRWPWMTLNWYKFKFSRNAALLHILLGGNNS